MLYLGKLGKNVLVIGKVLQLFKLCRIVAVAVSDEIFDEGGKRGVGVAEPTPVSYAVCNICKPLGVHAVEILKHRIHKNVGMEL